LSFRSWVATGAVASGRRTEAQTLFESLLALGNDLGLFAEEYDPIAKRQLGNFPQAFSHVGLIKTARALDRAPGGAWELSETSGSSPASD